jgi:hypothetical protein
MLLHGSDRKILRARNRVPTPFFMSLAVPASFSCLASTKASTFVPNGIFFLRLFILLSIFLVYIYIYVHLLLWKLALYSGIQLYCVEGILVSNKDASCIYIYFLQNPINGSQVNKVFQDCEEFLI